MATYNLQLPRMGESVSEATIVKWLKQPGDYIEEDEPILEVATDKVDSDVPSPVSGTLRDQLFTENAVAQVGDVIATIEVDGAGDNETIDDKTIDYETIETEEIPGMDQLHVDETPSPPPAKGKDVTSRFYSPLVKNIAAEEGIP